MSHTATTDLGGLWAPERRAVWLGVAGVTLLSWLYLWHLAAGMGAMMGGMSAAMVMPRAAAWSLADIGFTFAMWAVMMVGMMLPSAAPTIALFASLDKRRRAAGGVSSFGAFAAGYIAVWTGFSLVATLAQWGLDSALFLTMGEAVASPVIAGAILLAAGIFQLTPLKHACLTRCRSPLGFLLAHWRDGQWGAFAMGAKNGAFCLGCCGFLMLLLFVGGVMNLAWVAGLALLVMAEKLVPHGDRLARLLGVVLLAAGAWVLGGAVPV
jgi:predicted metal-binding membrane protein